MDADFKASLDLMVTEIVNVLKEKPLSIYLFGSVVQNDFRLGWSDIDILVLTKDEIFQEEGEWLVDLRQKLLKQFPSNRYFGSFEGGMISLNAFINNKKERAVYWGSSGQRLMNGFQLNSFCMMSLLESGNLIDGDDVRDQMTHPTYEQLYDDVIHHYETIRDHGKRHWGWLLDIARGIYTLQTGGIIAKTQAGEWVLEKGICPVPDTMKMALLVRKEPLIYKEQERFKRKEKNLEADIQIFADVLEIEISKRRKVIEHGNK